MIRMILKVIKFITEVLLLVGMIGIPAWLVSLGCDMTLKSILYIWIPLVILLAILLRADVRATKNDDKYLSDLRMVEKIRREDMDEATHIIKNW